ncbi:protein-L-isoaspartate O-methyltransferase [Candidatus Giovannonibacteria bacterium]|nr:protein-L-isoaspartate O-methyltransferase [Candidatus Giovannonibacteria bacterium]
MRALVSSLEKRGVLKSEQIIEALLKVDRKDFIPKERQDQAYTDEALPIGSGQTISQPYTVAFMLELLEPKKTEIIMDVGSGSGWTAAILAEIVGLEGEIYAFERIPELCEFGKNNLKKYPMISGRVSFFCRDASSGPDVPPSGGFDGIIAAAALDEVPPIWRKILKIGGRLIYPRDGSVIKEIKESEEEFEKCEYEGFAFVPYIKDENF